MKIIACIFLFTSFLSFSLSVCAAEKGSGYSVSSDTVISDKEKAYVTVEKMPEFPGGDSEMMKYISRNLRIPTEPQEAGISSRFTARFIVEKDGTLSDIKIMRSFSPEVDKNVEKMIKEMPKWIPGEQDGKAVRVYYTLSPIICLRIR